jgi:cysteine-rich repeat protein
MAKKIFIFLILLIFTSWGGSTTHAAKPYCGDGKCSPTEDVSSCPEDCKCGDGACDTDENPCDCPADCGSPPSTESNCSDGADNDCDGLVDCLDTDCAGTPECPCNKKEGADCSDCAGSYFYCCGLDGCDPEICGEDCGSTPGSYCGDGTVDQGEECDDGNKMSGDGCDGDCNVETTESIPINQYNIGDSIGEGEAADGSIGEAHHDIVWSTGYNTTDTALTMNERFEASDPDAYNENSVTMDGRYNKAISGAVMADFASQAGSVVSEAEANGGAGMITILLGNNDVCGDSLSDMTSIADFETQFSEGLDVLAASPATKNAHIHISGIPAIYWLWVAKKDSGTCRFVWWIGGVCQALLEYAGDDDCESTVSRDDPDNIYPGDGTNCLRRKEFHRRIRDDYNPKLKEIIEKYRSESRLPNAYYIDIFDIRFTSSDINNGDCFHPSFEGHDFLADEEWFRSIWGGQ